MREYLMDRLEPSGVDPLLLMNQVAAERNRHHARPWSCALGQYRAEEVPAAQADRFTAVLLATYLDDPDPATHSAIDLLLRRLGPWRGGRCS